MTLQQRQVPLGGHQLVHRASSARSPGRRRPPPRRGSPRSPTGAPAGARRSRRRPPAAGRGRAATGRSCPTRACRSRPDASPRALSGSWSRWRWRTGCRRCWGSRVRGRPARTPPRARSRRHGRPARRPRTATSVRPRRPRPAATPSPEPTVGSRRRAPHDRAEGLPDAPDPGAVSGRGDPSSAAHRRPADHPEGLAAAENAERIAVSARVPPIRSAFSPRWRARPAPGRRGLRGPGQ